MAQLDSVITSLEEGKGREGWKGGGENGQPALIEWSPLDVVLTLQRDGGDTGEVLIRRRVQWFTARV